MIYSSTRSTRYKSCSGSEQRLFLCLRVTQIFCRDASQSSALVISAQDSRSSPSRNANDVFPSSISESSRLCDGLIYSR